MRRNDFDDNFDRHFASTRRTVGAGMAFVFAMQLIMGLGSLAILGTFLWFMGRLAQVW